MSNTWKTTVDNIIQVDQTMFDFPHNTTFDVGPDKAPNQHEPYSPLPVTLDVVTNPENEAQNSPGGFPNRFCRSPQSEWFSDEGEIVPALQNMWKNKKASLEFPLAGSSVDGRTVGQGVPNQSSIGASLDDYTILKGIREVPFSAFTQMPILSYYSTDEEKRTKGLAEQIKQTGEITPLIVAIDNQGPYILEGGHRFDALRELGANSFPAMVVLDNDSLNREAAINSLTRDITASNEDGGWVNPSGEVVLAADHGEAIEENPDFFGIKVNRTYPGVIWSQVYESLYDKGFVRFRVWSNFLYLMSSSVDNLRNAESVIFKVLPDITEIYADLNTGNYTATVEEFKEKGFDAFSKQVPVMAKQAAITKQYALYIGGRLAIRTLTRQKALKTCQERFPTQFAAGDYEIKEEAYTVASFDKQAGSQSASVPDYLCDEFKTEQLYDDVSEAIIQ